MTPSIAAAAAGLDAPGTPGQLPPQAQAAPTNAGASQLGTVLVVKDINNIFSVNIKSVSGFERTGVGTRDCVLEMLRNTVHWPPIDPRRHPADERLWLIRTFNSGDLVGTYLASTRMRRAEMAALGHAQRLLRGDCARRRWIRVADRLV